jgi:hypothetical protein
MRGGSARATASRLLLKGPPSGEKPTRKYTTSPEDVAGPKDVIGGADVTLRHQHVELYDPDGPNAFDSRAREAPPPLCGHTDTDTGEEGCNKR